MHTLNRFKEEVDKCTCAAQCNSEDVPCSGTSDLQPFLKVTLKYFFVGCVVCPWYFQVSPLSVRIHLVHGRQSHAGYRPNKGRILETRDIALRRANVTVKTN